MVKGTQAHVFWRKNQVSAAPQAARRKKACFRGAAGAAAGKITIYFGRDSKAIPKAGRDFMW